MHLSKNVFSVEGESYFAENVKSVRIVKRYSDWVIISLFILFWILLSLLLINLIQGTSNLSVLWGAIVIGFFLALNKKVNSVLIVDMVSKKVAVYESNNNNLVESVKEQFIAGLETGSYPKLVKPRLEKIGIPQFYG